MSPQVVTLSQDDYETLKESADFLNMLLSCGVDNWEGYQEACDLMSEEG